MSISTQETQLLKDGVPLHIHGLRVMAPTEYPVPTGIVELHKGERCIWAAAIDPVRSVVDLASWAGALQACRGARGEEPDSWAVSFRTAAQLQNVAFEQTGGQPE